MRDEQDSTSANRDDLVERVALMESMISEGRRSTARWGWVFVMWGLLYFAATGWTMYLPHPNFAWPVCVTVGIAAGIVRGVRRGRSGEVLNARSRSILAVWQMVGAAVTLFCFSGAIAHHADGVVYVAAILFFIGLAHATSAVILRWPVQGAVAAMWWGCGIATMFVSSQSAMLAIFLTASFFGMILFGLYAMMLERRLPPAGMLRTA
jgi:hypothetical protein